MYEARIVLCVIAQCRTTILNPTQYFNIKMRMAKPPYRVMLVNKIFFSSPFYNNAIDGNSIVVWAQQMLHNTRTIHTWRQRRDIISISLWEFSFYGFYDVVSDLGCTLYKKETRPNAKKKNAFNNKNTKTR